MDYFYHLATFIAIYTILAQGLNLFSGYTGLLSLAHAGFYGIGAYVAALLAVHFGFPILLNFVIAGLFCGMVALSISFIALRTYEDCFVIVTLGIQIIAFSIMNNWIDLTNGPLGITNIPDVAWLPNRFAFMGFAVLIAGAFYFLLWRLSRSSWVLNLRGIRDDEILMQAMGKPVRKIKIVTFTLNP